jgi:Tol biopolymer transport system component
MLGAALLLARPVGAQAPDPKLTWRTIATPHFEITYHDPLGDLAQRVATAAEHAHRVLSASLGFESSQRTLVLLTDDADGANGFADVIPRNEIRLFAAAPDDLSSIGDYDDWLATLVVHEHTHIVHLDQIGGLSAVINALLGKTTSPNTVQPRWFIEGLAVHMESTHTSAGRVRSTRSDMTLRMDVLEDRVPSIDQLSNDPVRWPHGDLRYLYGGRFVAFIAERYGDAALSQMGKQYGEQWMPYGLNRIAKRATGRTFIELYDDFIGDLRARYAAQHAAVIAEGAVEGHSLTPHRDLSRAPRFLRDGRVVFYAGDGREPGALRTVNGDTLVRTTSEAVVAPHPDGQHLLYSQAAPFRDLYGFHDLFSLDLRSGQSTRLTHGMRAREPDVSPDGRDVVFVTQRAGTSTLEIAALDDIEGSRRVLMPSRAYDQVFTPRFSPDGKLVTASIWRAGGYRDIVIVDRATALVRLLTHDRAQDSGPTWSPDGTRVYFSSDRTGIANVYAFDLSTGTLLQITNVIGGAYQPIVSADGTQLVYVGYASTGYGLRALDLRTTTPRTAAPHLDRRPAPAQLADGTPLPAKPYSPWSTLPPSNYRLEIQEGALGTQLGLSVGGHDIAGFHSYALHAAVSAEAEVPSLSAGYSYGRMPLRPSVRVFRSLTGRSDLVVGDRRRRWIAENIGVELGVSHGFGALFAAHALDFDYALVHVDKARPFGGLLDPNDPPPTVPELGFIPSAGVAYRYSDVQRETYDISPSRGRNFTVRVDATDPIMGRDLRSVALRLSGRQFLPMPWWDHHVLAIQYRGGIAGGDAGRIGVFSVGGFPDEAAFPSLYDFALFGAVPALSGTALRGYPQGFRSGRQFHLFQAEYRFPVLAPEWGLATLPYYLRRLHASIFSDTGNAFSTPEPLSKFVVGVGAELFTTLEISYRFFLTLRLGVARGLSEGGVTQLYFHVGSPF